MGVMCVQQVKYLIIGLYVILMQLNQVGTVHQQKIRVVYLPPHGQKVPEEGEGMREEGPSSFMAITIVSTTKFETMFTYLLNRRLSTILSDRVLNGQ